MPTVSKSGPRRYDALQIQVDGRLENSVRVWSSQTLEEIKLLVKIRS